MFTAALYRRIVLIIDHLETRADYVLVIEYYISLPVGFEKVGMACENMKVWQ